MSFFCIFCVFFVLSGLSLYSFILTFCAFAKRMGQKAMTTSKAMVEACNPLTFSLASLHCSLFLIIKLQASFPLHPTLFFTILFFWFHSIGRSHHTSQLASNTASQTAKQSAISQSTISYPPSSSSSSASVFVCVRVPSIFSIYFSSSIQHIDILKQRVGRGE